MELDGFLRKPDQVTDGTESRSPLTLTLMIALRDFDADLADMLLQGLVTEVLLWQLSLSQRAAM